MRGILVEAQSAQREDQDFAESRRPRDMREFLESKRPLRRIHLVNHGNFIASATPVAG